MAHTRRTSRRWLILLGAILLLFVVAVVWVMVVRDRGTTGTVQMITTQENAPQENAPGSADGDATASKDEGWFTEEQASGGQEAYAQACAQCHGEELQGGVGPALTGQTFWDHWGGDTVYTFFEYIQRMMPQNAPGSLETETYTDVTAYLLQANGFPQGDEELPAAEDRLSELTIRHALTTDGGASDEAPAADQTEGDASQAASEGDATQAEGESDAQAASEGDATQAEGESDAAQADSPDDATQPASNGSADAAPSETTAAEGETDPDATSPSASTAEDGAGAPEGSAQPDEASADASMEDAGSDEATQTTEDGSSATFEEGWFARSQVQAGEIAFSENCARCHGDDLQGNPPLVGGNFPERYHTVWQLYQYVQQAMPLDRPGSLRDQTYLDAIAYVLDQNGYPVGEDRREPLRPVLVEMDLTAQAGSPATSAEEGAMEGQTDGGAESEPTDSAQGDGGEAPSDEDASDGSSAANEGADAAAADDGASSSGAQAGGEEQTSDEGSSNDGYYPQEQADRGGDPYAQNCAECHGEDLQGVQGQPALTGDGFLANHGTVWDLFDYARQNMPLTDPSSLDDETYADIVAHILAVNEFPTGGEPLGPDRQERMQSLPLDPEATQGDAPSQTEGEDGQAEGDAQTQAEGDSAATDDGAEADGQTDDAASALPELATLEIEVRPANVTLNILGPDRLARRAIGAQTLEDLQPGTYVIAAARGHESVTTNVEVAAGETVRVDLVLDELSRSSDVPEEPAIPLTEIPAIPKDPDEASLIGRVPPAAIVLAQGFEITGAGATPNTEFAAGRGQQAFALHCSRCHGADLQGNVAPALTGDVFLERWGGHPVDWLYFQARAAMPPHAAGFLDEQTYADIITYVLTEADVLEGFESFSPGDEAFRTLIVEPAHTGDPGQALEQQVDRLRETLHGPQDEGVELARPITPVEHPEHPGIAPIGYRGRIDSAAVVEAGDLSEPGPDVAQDTEAADGASEDGEGPAPGGQEANDGGQDPATRGETNDGGQDAPPRDDTNDGGQSVAPGYPPVGVGAGDSTDTPADETDELDGVGGAGSHRRVTTVDLVA